mgnify:CR=1 FL=1
MTAWYNEIDPYCAEWLRNLIKAGRIAPGEVDERSIEDVSPDDLKGFTQCHFFAGIGAWSLALRNAGWPDDRPVFTGSAPCQSFSTAGKRKGFADERHLWPAWFHLISECRPDRVFGEQVASKDGYAWLDLVWSDMEGLGYAFGPHVSPAAGYGAPHERHRQYFVAVAHHHQKPSRQRPEIGAPAWQRLTDDRELLGVELNKSDGREQRRSESSGRGVICGRGDEWMAHHHQGSQGRDERGDGSGQCASGAGVLAGGVGDTAEFRCNQQRAAEKSALQRRRTERSGQYKEPRHPRELPGGSEGLCRVGGLDNAASSRYIAERQGPKNKTRDEARLRLLADTSGDDRPGPVNGFWRDADWLFCRDGRWRPAQPGTFPLAHGASSRMGRLRAYGNAICASQAEEFIRSYLEIEKGLALLI